MDGRQILDGMNDDVVFGIRNGQAPWQQRVPTGMLRLGPSLTSVAGDAEGLAWLQLSCLENRFGYHNGAWSEKAFADHDRVDLEPDVRFFSTLDMSLHVDGGESVMSGRPVVVYNNDHEMSGLKGERFIAWPNPDRSLTAHILEELTARGGAEWNDPCEMRAGIYDLVAEREAGFSRDFSFGCEKAQASAICHNIISQRICCLFGHGWDADEARSVDPDAVAKAVRNDPFWLARVCLEAGIRQDRMLQPDTCSQTCGGIRDCRAACEDFLGSLRQEEKRQYLAVPFADNAEVKAKGGRFDRIAKAWYVPAGRDINDFARWDRPSEPSPEAEFADAMRHHGLLVEGEAIMDGQPHRVMLEGQRPGAGPAGSYTGYLDGRPAGHFINFRDGDGKAVKWVASGHRVDPQLRSVMAKEIEAKREARARETAAKQNAAARGAAARWNAASPVRDAEDHPYLAAKGVGGYAVRVDRHSGHLLVPLRDEAAMIASLQSIGRNPQDRGFDKRFTADGRKQGRFHLIHRHGLPQGIFGFNDPYDVEGGLRQLGMAAHVIFIAEGYATAASVHEATGRPVVVAFDAHNLKPVAELFRREIVRDRPFIFLADDDRNLKVNVGVGQAVEAAKAVGGAHVVVPRFDAEGLDAGLTDFNDLHRHAGIEAASRQLHAALAPVLRDFRVRRMGTDADEVRVYQSEDMAPKLTPKWERIMAGKLGKADMAEAETARPGTTRPGMTGPGRTR